MGLAMLMKSLSMDSSIKVKCKINERMSSVAKIHKKALFVKLRQFVVSFVNLAYFSIH